MQSGERINRRRKEEGIVRVLVYMKRGWSQGLRLESLLREAALDAKVEVCHTHTCLIRQIRRTMSGDLIVVLVASGGNDLNHLLSIKEFIDGIPVILILPDQERETVSAGHRLRPRFVSSVNSDFTDVSAVLAKMLERAERLRLSEERQEKAEIRQFGSGRGHLRNRSQTMRITPGGRERA